ncbi:TPA: ead/Ea22-like family protein [Klebsiella pneumoniae]|uniref:ead/Ea22-like family protein n=1 Tax=Klebsiella pneumoniae TaxID=573 RepID=UPI0019116F79|nr:ead/Ea22-like family protein [Klebsiella pneumoniae]MBK5710746.1 ead/Ea22-like family protein [Klebsiella pneumoniae]HBQ5076236.1 ead/Ea22-like family protein [Klebsiella pneumoniae]HCD4107068.1 ead/Ea22-like family protein [Klebsiella pneumoniae]HCT5382527.1 ead/Ea22-like family protein [Klebsiella pneumoniae]
MTDITALAQSLKAAAENAGADYWQAKKISGDFYVIRKGSYKRECGYTTYQPIAEIDHKPTRDYVAMANPTNILALVEALEKAQGMEAYWKTQCRGITDHCEELQARIAELESRTVTVKQGEVLVTVAGFTGCGKSAIAGEIEIAMKAIGVPVTWANGDSEKRMTGADWLIAIEMYKPTVRIVEVNIPRAAGIKVEAE